MTQLVQLQSIRDELLANGFTVFAISNDPLEVLSEFAAQHGIEYPLLSDEGSVVIQSFGIMNQLIDSDEGRSMRWYGIPYPGTYFLDADGVVVDKDFHQHHARRASGAVVLARALGQPIAGDAQTAIGSPDDEISLRVGLSDPALQLERISHLIVDIDIPTGRHMYAPGAPDAFTPLSIDVRAAGVRVGDVAWPKAQPLTMSELGLTCPTYNGRLRVEVPLTVTSELIRLGHTLATESVEISIAVRYQSCDEVTCGLPQDVYATLTLAIERLVEPEGLSIYADRVEQLEAERGQPAR